MDSRQLIDAQFDRAVEIVQGLPKTGPIQTDYEEKLTMYSLYKQATVGNVEGTRPSVWDMLGRAKWDAWAKHKDLDPYEAKWLYVDALLKVLRKYSDKTVAMDLVRELESYNGDASNLIMSHSFSRSRSSSSGSSQPGPSGSHYNSGMPSFGSDEDDEDEVHDQLPATSGAPSAYAPSLHGRPQSTTSAGRYRTPMASMLVSPPPVSRSTPPTQPRPAFETPSTFAGHVTPPTTSSSYPPGVPSYSGDHPRSSRTDLAPTPHNPYVVQPPYRSASRQQITRPFPLQSTDRTQLERDDLQLRIRVLEERLERLEFTLPRSTSSLVSHSRGRSPHGPSDGPWDAEHMGMWALVLNPLSAVMDRFKHLIEFLAYNPDRSPGLLVVRRLFLDVSFLLCLLTVLRLAWRKSGVRRKEVIHALKGVWWAIVGHQRPKALVDRAV
ncbi:acyl CoA binding protein-domain-containing protein [Irpex rosettiformis]|uniref:Acyl CoA binding protein-domain-containing protein n=1 Tax=Irpex rosettiformis TaxID=378272 RepID=A0ACB8UDZ5_9APHY|nr:acyl CoA binding protein-domain-containing protein [Irpex rosettiformis]